MEIRLQTLFVSHDRIALRWEPSEDIEDDVRFEVQRSGSAVTGFEPVGAVKALAYVDRIVRHGKFDPLFYRVEAIVEGERVVSNVAALSVAPDDAALRFGRRERFQLARFDGVPALLYARRRSGKRCTRCARDPVRGPAGSNCTVCFGVGLEGGYYPPVPFYIGIQALKSQGVEVREEIISENSNGNCWTSNWTLIAPEDVLVEMVPPNHVWHVTGVQRTERRRYGVRQILTIKEADIGGPLARLPIPDFAFPDRSRMWYLDPVEGRDFETVFAEVLDAAMAKDSLGGAEDGPGYRPSATGAGPGTRNPETGVWS